MDGWGWQTGSGCGDGKGAIHEAELSRQRGLPVDDAVDGKRGPLGKPLRLAVANRGRHLRTVRLRSSDIYAKVSSDLEDCRPLVSGIGFRQA